MAAIFLTEQDVESLLDMPTAVDVVGEAFRQLARGEAVNVPRSRAEAPGFVLHSMSASAAYLGLAGWKQYTTTKQGAKFLVGLYDLHTGDLLALISADRLGQLRTGATTGVAVQWLAAPTATEVGLFGAGWQAEGQLAAVAAARPIKTAYVYCRNEERRRSFADRMSNRLEIEVIPVDRPQAAAEDVPIIVTATKSREPVFDGNNLAEGTLVCAVGSNWLSRAELDATVIRRADHIVCDSVEACRPEAGDFCDAISKGYFDWSRAVDLADVVAGRSVGRSKPEDVVVFKSVGMGIEDVALGSKLLELALARGTGVELPL